MEFSGMRKRRRLASLRLFAVVMISTVLVVAGGGAANATAESATSELVPAAAQAGDGGAALGVALPTLLWLTIGLAVLVAGLISASRPPSRSRRRREVSSFSWIPPVARVTATPSAANGAGV